MTMQKVFSCAILSGAVALVMTLPVFAQDGLAGTVAMPDYNSHVSSQYFNTPESDGRPGEYYFLTGAQAVRKGDYKFAIDMYKVAASWAYKPAEYNLALMYFKGQGVPVDRARGAAWMVLAAERNDSALYTRAQNLMVSALTKEEFQRTDEIWNELKPTYGDATALRRAKIRWAQVKSSMTGSRVGGAGHVLVGGGAGTGSPQPPTGPQIVTGFGVYKSGGVADGAIAYRQFQQSDNPYDPVFQKNRIGSVTVKPLQRSKPAADKANEKSQDDGGSAQPVQPRSA